MKIKSALIFVMILALSVSFWGCAKKDKHNESSAVEISSQSSFEHEISQNITSTDIQSQTSETSTVSSKDTIKTESLLPQDKAKAGKLVAKVKQHNESKISFFYVENKLSFVGFEPIENVSKFEPLTPFAEITDAEKIKEFKNNLQLDKWEAQRFTTLSMPIMYIYLGDDLHINLEVQYNGISWMSINSLGGSFYYVVPDEVYNSVLAYYK